MGLTLNASNGVRPLTEAEKAAVRKDLDVVGYVNGSLVSADGNSIVDVATARGGSRLKRGFPILRTPNTLDSIPSSGTVASNGLLFGGGGGAAPTGQIVRRNGRNAFEVTFQGHTNTQSVYWKIPSRTYSNLQQMVFEVEDAAEWNGGTWVHRLCTDVNINVGVQQVLNVARNNGWSGIHQWAPKAADWAVLGAGSFASTMTYAAFRGARKAGANTPTRIWFYEWAEDEAQSLPQIVIGADDGHMTWYERGLPILENDGWSSYLAYIADEQNGTLRMRDGVEWIDAISRGHHAVVHGCRAGINSLADYFTLGNYAPYGSPQAAMEADISYNRDRMLASGLDPTGQGRKIYVLPQGLHQPSGGAGDNTIVTAMRNCGMVMARRAVIEGDILPNGGGRGSMLYLPIIGHNWSAVDEAANVAAVITAIQTAVAAGRSVVLMFHEVRDTPTLAEQITPANLTSIVRACTALVRSGAARQGTMYSLLNELTSYTSPVHIGA